MGYKAPDLQDDQRHSSSIPYDVSIVDIANQDISHRVQVRHLHHPSTSPQLVQKRAPFSREISECPPDPDGGPPSDWVFYSFCLHGRRGVPYSTSAQAWYIECHARNKYSGYSVEGMCEANEICVDGPQPPGTWRPPGFGVEIPRQSFARCVSHEFYQKLITKGGQSPAPVDQTFVVEKGKQNGFEATLTTEDSKEVVIAETLAAQPLESDGRPTAKEVSCSTCSEIDIDSVPATTSKVRVKVGRVGVGVALLYLTSTVLSALNDPYGYSHNLSAPLAFEQNITAPVAVT
ncbi:hypothetical protein ACLMJK_006044 [Lecanora helva]